MQSHTSNLTSQIQSYAIIVAGGTGTRMQSVVPKQFLLLNGKPVIMHSIENFSQSNYKPEIIVVLHPGFHDYWKELCQEHHFTISHRLVAGGDTRFHSVKNGLDSITAGEGLVAVHDAVRPLTLIKVIDQAYQQAAEVGNAVVAVKSRDSVRQLVNGKSAHLKREEIYLVQTPQTFQLSLLRKAYTQPYDDTFTDDASVVEHSGADIHLAEGDHNNLKITFPEDIAIAGLIQKKLLE